jgi:carboxypeptidase PM20D1
MSAVAPDCVQAPSLVVGATDARHYARLSDHVYRFVPMRLRPEDLPRIHGVDERISVENLAELVRFYLELALSA